MTGSDSLRNMEAGVLGRKGWDSFQLPVLPQFPSLSGAHHVPEAIRTSQAQGPARILFFELFQVHQDKGSLEYLLQRRFLPTAPDTTAHCAISSPWSCLTPLPHHNCRPQPTRLDKSSSLWRQRVQVTPRVFSFGAGWPACPFGAQPA